MKSRTIHFVNKGLAKEYGIDLSCFISNIYFNRTKIKEGVDIDGDIYFRPKYIYSMFPYWTHRKIYKLANQAERLELLQLGDFGRNAFENAKWFALTLKASFYFEDETKKVA